MSSIAVRSDPTDVGRELYALIDRLYPIFRSITGDGVRETLSILSTYVPLEVHEIPTGTAVLDWTVPREWSFRDAFVKDATGRKVIDAAESNLHLVNYSTSVHRTMPWSELRPHVHSLPEHPDLIPYRTSYFHDTWGFCVTHRQLSALEAAGEQHYEVHIDTTHRDGSLTYGEVFLPGEVADEVLISAHVCHPSLANDNLSGIAVATFLARHLADVDRHYSYRFVFAPATIGAITWLSVNEDRLANIKHGLVLTLLGDSGAFTYKRSRRGTADIDRLVPLVLQERKTRFTVRPYAPFGYDERQFCSPGFNLPVGCLMRTPNGEFPEYHTSGDNLDLVQAECLAESWAQCVAIMELLEHNHAYVNQKPKGEPRLGPLGLYAAYGSEASKAQIQQAVLWVLNLSDGFHTLVDIAERAALPFSLVRDAAEILQHHGLLRKVTADNGARRMANGRDLVSSDQPRAMAPRRMETR